MGITVNLMTSAPSDCKPDSTSRNSSQPAEGEGGGHPHQISTPPVPRSCHGSPSHHAGGALRVVGIPKGTRGDHLADAVDLLLQDLDPRAALADLELHDACEISRLEPDPIFAGTGPRFLYAENTSNNPKAAMAAPAKTTSMIAIGGAN